MSLVVWLINFYVLNLEFRIKNIEYLFWFFLVRLPEENNKYLKFDMFKSMSYQRQYVYFKQYHQFISKMDLVVL